MSNFLIIVGVVLLLSAIYIYKVTGSDSIKGFAVLIGLIGIYLAINGMGILPPSWPQ
jgi:hypothetical protein